MRDNMKYILPLIVSLLSVSACDLNPELELNLTKEDVEHTYSNTMGRATAVYSFLPDGFSYINGALLDSASDDAEHTSEGSSVHKFNTGSWSYLNNPDGAWTRCFKGIYAANLFLANSDEVELEHLKYDPDPSVQAQYELYMNNLQRAKYEVRFLRAFFYFELVQRYGGVPILEEAYGVDYDFSKIERDSFESVIGFIVSECEEAADNLPVLYDSDQTGRATRGAALALKSRALLFAASDLYNDSSWAGGYGRPELIAMPAGSDRVAQWDAAARAAKAVLDMATDARYTLVGGANYGNIFLQSSTSSEVIFCRRYGAGTSFEAANYPIGYDNGNSGTTPSQNLVDAFEMKTGAEFSWDGLQPNSDPYANRDPRLGFDIITNGSTFKSRTVDIFEGGRDGKGVANATKTGYYLRKYVDPDCDLLLGRGTVHAWIIFRLAEMYLNYAEAMNEAYGPTGDPNGYGMTARDAVNRIRQRSGVGQPALGTSLSQEEMRAKIRNERRVELCFEGHRVFDVRRWMIAEETLGAPLRGVDIVRNSQSYIYTPMIVESRVFEPKMYFYPIPQTDLKISGWPQNPLW